MKKEVFSHKLLNGQTISGEVESKAVLGRRFKSLFYSILDFSDLINDIREIKDRVALKDKKIQDLERLIDAQREEIYEQRKVIEENDITISHLENEVVKLETIIEFFNS